MALFRNTPIVSGQVSVKLRVSLCDVLSYVSVSRPGGIFPRQKRGIVD